MVIAALVIMHIILLHTTGSNNPLGLVTSADKIPFHRYYTIKDVVGFVVLFILYLILVMFSPN